MRKKIILLIEWANKKCYHFIFIKLKFWLIWYSHLWTLLACPEYINSNRIDFWVNEKKKSNKKQDEDTGIRPPPIIHPDGAKTCLCLPNTWSYFTLSISFLLFENNDPKLEFPQEWTIGTLDSVTEFNHAFKIHI